MDVSDFDLLMSWIIKMGDRPGSRGDLDEINEIRRRGLADWVHPNDMHNFEIIYTDKAREILKNGT
jgi:hypothetical protein